MSALSSSSSGYPQTAYFSETYKDARDKLHHATEVYPGKILYTSLPIEATGFNEEVLSVDIVWIGPREAKDILIHISGTHGVEGFAGSAIQTSLVADPIELPENTSLIIIHGLNPYGMAHFRRVSENNIDLNRNFSKDRTTPPTYAKIDALMNPREYELLDFFTLRLGWEMAFGEGWDQIVNVVANGQYDFPEGLFYGGREIEEAPRLVFEWFEKTLVLPPSEHRFTIIDVHTGLGSKGKDTLLPIGVTTQEMIDLFGSRILPKKQKKTVEYAPTGMFIEALSDVISKITPCALENIIAIGQEFGTVSNMDVLNALRDENTVHHEAKRAGRVCDPNHPKKQELLRAFYPIEPKWRNSVLTRGRELVAQALERFTNQPSIIHNGK